MFEKLIQQALPTTVHQLYELARRHQPQDCKGAPCPHRAKMSSDDMEWMHQLRRELQNLGIKVDRKRNGVWRLKTATE